MNIQISVIIWTVICFSLLMLILNKLLFTPVLSVLDAREKRIKNAAICKAANEKAMEDAKADLEAKRSELRMKAAAEADEAVEKAHAEAEDDILKKQKSESELYSNFCEQLVIEKESLLGKTEVAVSRLSGAFVSGFVS